MKLFSTLVFLSVFLIKPENKEYSFDTLVEYESRLDKTIYMHLFNSKDSTYKFSCKSIYQTGALNDSDKNLHTFKLSNNKNVIEFTFESSREINNNKNTSFVKYTFEKKEIKLDSITTHVSLFGFTNNKKKSRLMIELEIQKNDIIVDEKFLNHFCHGYFSNTDYQVSLNLPKKIIVHNHYSKKIDTIVMIQNKKINTQLRVK